MNLWRIHLKPASKSGTDSRKYCIDNKIVGFGWPIQDVNALLSSSEYEEKGKVLYANNGDKSWYPAWNSLHYKMQIGDLVWTRKQDGVYYLGRITGDWRYEYSKSSEEADIVNVRNCDWIKIGTVGDCKMNSV